MSGPVESVQPTLAVVQALQRLASALEDMAAELPGQTALVKSESAGIAQKAEVPAILEKQLRWLADDMARARRSLTAEETSHDGNE